MVERELSWKSRFLCTRRPLLQKKVLVGNEPISNDLLPFLGNEKLTKLFEEGRRILCEYSISRESLQFRSSNFQVDSNSI